MSEELKPCPNPICRSKELSVIVEDSGCAHCFCTSCGVCGPTSAQGYFGAIAAWNALPRAPHIATIDELLRLREQVEALTNTRAVQLQDKL